MKTTSLSPTLAVLPQALQDLYARFCQQPGSETASLLVKEYFACFGGDTISRELWRMLAGTLSDPRMPQLQKGIQRHNLLFFYEFTLIFMEAAELLSREEK